MKWITKEDLQRMISKTTWDFDRLSTVVGDGLSLRDFIAHPEVQVDEAILVALNNKGIEGVSFKVRRALVAFGVDRAVLKLAGSPLPEVQDFYANWVKSPPAIKGEWDQPSEVFGDAVQRVSIISCLTGDWRSFTVLQMIHKAHRMYLNHETVRGILLLLRFVYTGSPDGWVTERNQQYKDLVKLVNETGE